MTKYFDKHKTNIFNSNILGANCLDCENAPLQDGIYIVKVTGSPSTFFKEAKYLKTDALQMEIDKIYIDSFGDAERETRMMYEQAEKMVEKLKNCKSCK